MYTLYTAIILYYCFSLNEVGGTFENIRGVQIQPGGFGQTAEVEFLTDHAQFKSTGYLYKMVEYFVKNHGYVRGKSFAAAPYDWRLAAGAHKIITNLYAIIMYLSTYQYCNDCKIHTESLGGRL